MSPDVGGCVNKVFEGIDDGFHTIDLRNRRDDGDRVSLNIFLIFLK